MRHYYYSSVGQSAFFRKLFIVILLIVNAGVLLQAQTVRNVKAIIRDGKVEVRYDLIAPDKNYEFNVELFGSSSNYTTPLKQVQGDVGKRVTAGDGKLIIWDPKGELQNYKGELQFEVRAKAASVAPPIAFSAPAGGNTVRLGKNIAVRWQGGDPTEQLKLQLVQGTKLVIDYGAYSNKGSVEVTVDKKLSPGDYQLKLIGYEGEVFSKAFVIKQKPSPLLKIIPVALLLGGGAAVLMGGAGGGSTVKELPVAPEPN